MSEQQWKLVPTLVTSEIDSALLSVIKPGVFSTQDVLDAILRAAPQPPARGGEPEILAWLYKRHDQSPYGKPSQHVAIHNENLTEVREGLVGVGIPCDNHFDWQALVDRAHVANLQAQLSTASSFNREQGEDIERLQGEVEQERRSADVSAKDANEAEARNAELEGLLREAFSELSEMKNQIGYRGATLQIMGRIDAALAEGAKS